MHFICGSSFLEESIARHALIAPTSALSVPGPLLRESGNSRLKASVLDLAICTVEKPAALGTEHFRVDFLGFLEGVQGSMTDEPSAGKDPQNLWRVTDLLTGIQ